MAIRYFEKNPARQYAFSISLIVLTSIGCFFLSGVIGYKVVAFVLLLVVSLIAMFFDIVPVLVTATLSALIWNYFFIPPHFTFRIGNTEDIIFFSMYFVVALVSSILTYKIRRVEKIAMQKEEKANTVKLYNTLLNSLSHELRTPIATIIAATDNLSTENNKLTHLQKNELVNEISKASFRLNQQVDNLLNMSRLDSGIIKTKNDWCDVEELVYSVVEKVRDNSGTTKWISINVNPAIPLFKIDKGMLEQALYNLISNAVIYTPDHTKIEVTVVCFSDVLQVIVEDNGLGFPPDQLEKVFEKFYRLPNSKSGGTGLGLSIVKGFVEAMKGSVALQNKPEGGARFTINIAAETSYLKNLKNE